MQASIAARSAPQTSRTCPAHAGPSAAAPEGATGTVRNTSAFSLRSSIARASALGALARRLSADEIDIAREGLGDPDPMVRIGALDMIAPLAGPDRRPVSLDDIVAGAIGARRD